MEVLTIYLYNHIIPKKSLGLFSVKELFFGLIFEEAYFLGAYFRDEIRVKKGGGLIIDGYISATVTKRIRIILL